MVYHPETLRVCALKTERNTFSAGDGLVSPGMPSAYPSFIPVPLAACGKAYLECRLTGEEAHYSRFVRCS